MIVVSRGTVSDVCNLENCAIESMAGNSRDRCSLVEFNYREACNYGLFSLTRVLRDGWSTHRNAEATKMKKKGRNVVFSFKTNTTRVAAVAVAVVAVVALCCARLQRPYVDVAAPSAHGTRMAGLRELVGADDSCADDAPRLLGHMELDAIRAAAARPPGKQIECEACALEKAEHKNANTKADAPQGQSAVNAACGAGSRTRACRRPVAVRTKTTATTNEIMTKDVAKVDEAVAIAASTGDEAATKITSTPDEAATKTAAAANRGRQDRGHGGIHGGRGRNEDHVHDRQKMRPWPVSTVVAARARAMMMAATLAVVKHRFVIFEQAAKRAVKLDWLMVVESDVDSTTRIEHCGQKIPAWTSCVRTLGEPSTGIIGNNRELCDPGITMCVGPADDHTGDVYISYVE